MKLGKYELNQVYCADSYKAIKELPDNCIDCIYTDIPYLYQQGGSGNSALGERTAKKRLELMGATEKYLNDNTTRKEALRIAKNAQKKRLDFISIEDGIDYSILTEFVRVMKKTNIFIWCSKLQILDIMNFFIGGGDSPTSLKFLLGAKQTRHQQQITLGYPILNIAYILDKKEFLIMQGMKINQSFT